jgi:hypothetical protein
MNEAENPYSPPRATIDSVPHASKTAALSYGGTLVAIVIRVGIRFFGSLATTFLALMEFKGLGVNWFNAVPLLGVLWIGCMVSHFVLNLRSTSDRLNFITGWPLYLAGMIVAIIIVANEMHPKGF